jgi:peptidoglycan-N-acetylglucosamine deacetylase
MRGTTWSRSALFLTVILIAGPLPQVASPEAVPPSSGRTPAPLPAPTAPPIRTRNTPTPSPPETPKPPAVPTPGSSGSVALTFDDGPHPRHTREILDILEAAGAKGTFFIVGMEAERHPELVREIVVRGHVVAGHTWSHARLTGLDEASFTAEVDRANTYLTELTGQTVRYVRPPFGAYDSTTVARLEARGLELAMWTHDSRDWAKPGVGAVIDRATRGIGPGSIVLFHDGGGDRSQTVQALPQVIERIAAAGLRLEGMHS